MKLILAITTVAMLMGTYAAMPSPDTGNLMSLIKELLAAKRNEVSVSGPAVIENKASAAGSLCELHFCMTCMHAFNAWKY